jgi:hypothetical protein
MAAPRQTFRPDAQSDIAVSTSLPSTKNGCAARATLGKCRALEIREARQPRFPATSVENLGQYSFD